MSVDISDTYIYIYIYYIHIYKNIYIYVIIIIITYIYTYTFLGIFGHFFIHHPTRTVGKPDDISKSPILGLSHLTKTYKIATKNPKLGKLKPTNTYQLLIPHRTSPKKNPRNIAIFRRQADRSRYFSLFTLLL